MSQVVSRNRQLSGGDNGNTTSWKRPIMITFHGLAASTYGFAICWQNVSAASAELYRMTSPAMRVYGKWRFLTYNCLVMQFVAFSLCLTSHFVPRLRRPRDFFFTTFAFPIGMLVVGSFWAIWFTMGREFIFPSSIEPFYPPWLNHVTHTIIAPINLMELLLTKHEYSSNRKSLSPLAGYILSYTSFTLYIRFQTGRFVYPFLNNMNSVSVGAFIVGMMVFGVCIFKSGQVLHNFVHGVKTAIKGKAPKKKKG